MKDAWEIIQRRMDSEDKDCFYSISYFEWFRDERYRKENSRRQKLTLLAWTPVILGSHFFEGG